MTDATIHPDLLTALPADTIAAFLTLGGALVVFQPSADQSHFHWTCLGCGEATVRGGQYRDTHIDANKHAGWCRGIPLPRTHR